MPACRICNNAKDNKAYVAREMLLGYRDEFEYFECSRCGCLQIKEVPDDLRRYYPADCYYYEQAKIPTGYDYAAEGLKGLKARLIRGLLTRHYFYKRSAIGAWLEKRSCVADDYPRWLKLSSLNLQLNTKSSVLDVGCATGQLLLNLRTIGFTDLLGVDPFIEDDIAYGNGVKVLKRDLESLDRKFDFVMMHHAFEHVPDPLPTLKRLSRLLKPKRYALIRIPVAASYGWRKYGINWVLLDAPRHLFLHTTKSMEMLAEQAGFKVAGVVFDSDGFTFWGSEQYLRDIPLMDSRSYGTSHSNSIFTKEQIDSFNAQAAELNEKGQGDCAAFYLYKS